MLKNNIYSISVHLCFMFIFFINYLTFDKSNEMYGSDYYIYPFFNIITILIYLWVGSKLADQGSKSKNLLSVSAISIIGLLFWFICYYVIAVTDTSDIGLGYIGPEILWWLYFFYNHLPVTLIVFDQFGIRIDEPYFPYLAFIFNMMPSLIIWLGLQWEIKYKRRRQK
jgi:hypothetical protein